MLRSLCLGCLAITSQAHVSLTHTEWLGEAPGCAFPNAGLTRRALLGAATSGLALASPLVCFADDGSWADHTGPFTDKFFQDFKSTDTGFMYKFIKPGEGEKPANMQQVFVHYTGYLLDGTKFDSSYDKGDPFKFRLGKGKVIAGWEAVVGGMRPGQKVIVQIPSKYGYGGQSLGPIPADSPLVFYMELVKLGNIKGDKPRLSAITDAISK